MRRWHAVRRLADRMTPEPGQHVRVVNATVTTVTAGAAADGTAAAFIAIGADSVPAAYLASYSPAVGHMVRVLLVDGSPLILGRVTGLPAF